jgi:hypothetical protein
VVQIIEMNAAASFETSVNFHRATRDLNIEGTEKVAAGKRPIETSAESFVCYLHLVSCLQLLTFLP